MKRKEYKTNYYRTHRVEISKKLLYEYSLNSIKRLLDQNHMMLAELCERYPYEIYCEKNFHRTCYKLQIRKNSYQYDECQDACTTAYFYSICHCTFSDKKDDMDYAMAYIRKLMKIYAMAAIIISRDADNLCKINGFRKVNLNKN